MQQIKSTILRVMGLGLLLLTPLIVFHIVKTESDATATFMPGALVCTGLYLLVWSKEYRA